MFAGINKILKAIIGAPSALLERLTSKWVLVIGHSMHPTLREGQRVRVSRWAYRKADPARWDVVLFEHPHREGFWETKRVIGLPGELVRLIGGRLLVDGQEIEEPFVEDVQPRLKRLWELGEDEYIVMGDNRRRSTDSRSFGPVPRRNIVGKVILIPSEPDQDPFED